MIEVFVTMGRRIKIRKLSARGVLDPYFHLYASLLIEECMREGFHWSISSLLATEVEKTMWQHAEAMVLTEHFNRQKQALKP